MKYLVTGAGGFLGSTLVKHLQEAGEEVYAARRKPIEGSVTLDITKPEHFDALDIQPDIIINCASALPDGGKSFSDPDYLRQLFETNVIGSTNLMNWAASRKIPKVINCSTLVVVNKPWPVPLKEEENTYPKGGHVGYSASKLSQELVMSSVAEAKGVDLLHVRISALYGPGMKEGGILTKLLKQAAANEKISLTNGNGVSFDFLHVEDAAKILYHLSRMKAWPRRVLNLASGEEIGLLELAETLCRLTGNTEENIENTDQPGVSSRAKVDTTLLEKYLEGSGISTRPFSEKVKSMLA
ncbi:NAD(P)-dependent oxidoreductase [Pontibacter diazotrophicus]|uniref:NAD(P)-dependent oxidoreductase n=1 Tax=Pontibacter diazotrophicus TaxID=1400979 RepID=A0A3D8LGW0_9BACT|nr:NAD(P)-dependent oxidoreductase [Pontibacter diazotrophicus]RDV16142.1 NAD(P)-dependent oxidoreductase [Pontibacter diazotrophicus]